MSSRLTYAQMLSIIQKGLGKTDTPQKIVVIGAGMAGLVAASLLKSAGHCVEVIEASDRVGGRVYSVRQPFSSGLHFEAGAMRISSTHHLVLEYIRKFQLQTRPFINETPYDWIYVNGIKVRRWGYERNPELLGYLVSASERGRTAEELFNYSINPIMPFIHFNYDQNPIEEILGAYTIETYLLRNPYGRSLSPGALEMIQVLLDLQGLSGMAITDTVQSSLPFLQEGVGFYEIVGGNDRLPYALSKELEGDIHFHRRVTRITAQNKSVDVHTYNTLTFERSVFTGDRVITAIPFTMLRLIEIDPYSTFSLQKWKAIRELHYVAATKIGLEFKSRFWEPQGNLGGVTITDMPMRLAHYPSGGTGTGGPATILGSYTIGDDTVSIDSQKEERRLQIVLKNLAHIHGEAVFREFVAGAAVSWRNMENFAGAFVEYKPEQKKLLFPYASTPEGRIHFAGEHTSQYRAWIQGAIESGIRAAYEVHYSPYP